MEWDNGTGQWDWDIGTRVWGLGTRGEGQGDIKKKSLTMYTQCIHYNLIK